MATLFTARYDGFCRKCLVDIYAGDEVAYSEDDEIICANCLEDELGQAAVDDTLNAPSSGWRKKK